MTYPSLMKSIDFIQQKGQPNVVRTFFAVRVLEVLDVIERKKLFIERSTSTEKNIEYLDGIEQAILDLAHCGNYGTARYIADTHYKLLDEQYGQQSTLQYTRI